MKNCISAIIILLFPVLAWSHSAEKANTPSLVKPIQKANAKQLQQIPQPLAFLENKGQITDQYGAARRDIDIKIQAGGVNIFTGDGQMHYQWAKPNNSMAQLRNSSIVKENILKEQLETYRMDVVLVGANVNAEIIKENKQDYFEQYYLPQCPDGARTESYQKITYKNIYPHIDWVLYTASPSGDERGSYLKYDFVVHPGGNPADIQLAYAGATAMNIKKGALTVTTPFGSITEQAPYSWQASIGNSQSAVNSKFILEGNTLQFKIDDYDKQKTLVIDPQIDLEWATYYGGNGNEPGSLDAQGLKYEPGAIATDLYGDVYIAGSSTTTANIATSGTYQTNFAGQQDAFIVKFNTTGTRLWATYYGGTANECLWSAACDDSGNLYLAGRTNSNGLGTGGTHQSSFAGGIDGLLLKFNNGGSRIWATYYGGIDTERITTVNCDATGNVYIGGSTNSLSGISTIGAHQPLFGGQPPGRDYDGDGFLAKFNTNGQRLWGTYYGGDSIEAIQSIACDDVGNVYAGGWTNSITKIASTGALQAAYGGNNSSPPNSAWGDGFLVKFNNTGQRQWATYYGGAARDMVFSVGCDHNGNVYIGGNSESPYVANVISTPGAYATTGVANSSPGFLAKFNGAGIRQWGTYLAWGTWVNCIKADRDSNIFIGGFSISQPSAGNPVMTSVGSHQTTITGNLFDAFLSEFTASGNFVAGTYFGGANSEFNCNMALSTIGKVYIGGGTRSTSGIATPGAHQTVYGGHTGPNSFVGDAFVASMLIDSVVFIRLPYTDTLFCAGDSIYVRYGVNRKFRSNNVFTLQLSDDTGSFINAVNIGNISATDSGTVHGRIPLNTPKGSGYRIRIKASNASRTSYDNGVDIRIKPVPGNFTVSSNTPVCMADTLKLQGSSDSTGIVWAWTGPQSYTDNKEDSSLANAQINMSGDYILTATLDGCSIKDTATVLVKPIPDKPVATDNGPLCTGANLNLTVISSTMGVSYNWEGPGGYNSTNAAPTRTNVIAAWSGDYIASAILNGCPTKDTVTVVIHPVPVTPTAGSNSPVCVGGEIQFTASVVPGATYQWNGPGLYNSTQQNAKRQNVQLTDAGIYTVIAKVNNCPSAPANTSVVVNQGPEVLTYPNPGDTLCPGWDVSFVAVPKNAGGTPSYAWYKNGIPTGSTATSYKATGVSDGDSFYVLMTAGSACNTPISSKPIRITVLPVHTPPTISISSNLGAHVWPYVEVIFKASTGNSGAHPGYQWTRNGNDISKANDSTWSATDLKTGDTICCVVTSNFLCAVPREVMSNCIVMNVDLGVEEKMTVGGLRLYPNPNDGSFTLETSEPGILNISNLHGQTIGEYKVQKGKNSIQLPEGIADGIYMGRFGDSAVRINVVR